MYLMREVIPGPMSLRYTEASLPDSHAKHEPPPYSTRAFFNPCFICLKKDLTLFLTQWQNSVTKDINYLLMNSAFDYSLSGL